MQRAHRRREGAGPFAHHSGRRRALLRARRLQAHPARAGENAGPGRSGAAAGGGIDRRRLRGRVRPGAAGLGARRTRMAARPREGGDPDRPDSACARMAEIGLPAFARPGRGQRSDQQQQAEQPGKDRQHADAAQHGGVAQLQARASRRRGRSRSSARRRCAACETEPLSSRRRASPPVAVGKRAQHFGGRGDFGEFARIDRADIDQRGQLAVGRAPQPEFVRGRRAAPQAGLGLRSG